MDLDLKMYLDKAFEGVRDQINAEVAPLAKDIVRLQENDVQHFGLDRDHREICASNRETLKTGLDDTLSRFGERIGAIETTQAVKDTETKAIKTSINTIIADKKSSSNNFQVWLRTLFPYAVTVCAMVYAVMQGV